MPRVRRKAFDYSGTVLEDSTEEHHNEVNYVCIGWLVRRAFSEPLKLRDMLKELVPERIEGKNMCQLLGTVHVLSASESLAAQDEDLTETPRKVDSVAEQLRRLETNQGRIDEQVAEIKAMLANR